MFIATRANWAASVQGAFSATEGVLRGRIRFVGSLARILPYSKAFNRLADAACATTGLDEAQA